MRQGASAAPEASGAAEEEGAGGGVEDEGAGGPEIISPFAPQRVHFFQTEPSLSVSCPLKSCPSAWI